jgi:predicted  nucleic acid-binding Zn-ribbon protein
VLEKDTAKDELRGFEQKITLMKKEVLESNEALAEMKHQYGALKLSAEIQEKSFVEQQKAHEQANKAWQIERSGLHTKIEHLDMDLRNNDDKVAQLKEEVEKLEKELKELRLASEAERIKLEQQRADLEANLRELEQNQKIAGRKRNQLVKELKTQLKKEALETHRLKASNSRLQDDIRSSRTNLSSRSLNLGIHSQSSSQSNNSANAKRLSLLSSPSLPKTAAPVKIVRSNSLGSDTLRASSESEVVVALSKKVTYQEEKNHTLKQQINYLEEAVREANQELEKNKNIVRNIIQRTKFSALSSGDIERHIMEKNKRSTLAKQSPQELLSKMELFVQETSLQNAHLRKDIETMGVEIQKLFKENQALKTQVEGNSREQITFLE